MIFEPPISFAVVLLCLLESINYMGLSLKWNFVLILVLV
jgi:hypothetical protein